MNFSEIYEKSKKLNSEILVEVKKGLVIQEKIGSRHKVEGTRFTGGSDIYHTHLDTYPPSAQDLLTGLMCSMLYRAKINGVIGAKYIYSYTYSSNLRGKFKTLLRNNSKDKAWRLNLHNKLTKINRQFILTNNKQDYLESLYFAGINMTLEERN